MNTKTAVVASVAAVVAAGALYVGGFKSLPPAPSDLRDAVSDSSFDALRKETGAEASEVKVPKPEIKPFYVETTGRNSGGIRVKSISLKAYKGAFQGEKSAGGGAFSDAARFDKAASDALSKLPGGTPYEKVKALFESGVPATQADLTGIKAGRVFIKDGSIEYAGLIGMMVKVPEEVVNGGPLFPPANEARFVLGFTADDMEKLSTDEMVRFKMEFERSSDFHYSTKFPEAVAVATRDNMTAKVKERKAQGYIVEKYVVADAREERIYYSYYFKDVTPKK